MPDSLLLCFVVNINLQQKGFIPVDGCGEHVALLTSIMAHSRQKSLPLNVVWLDISKAFNTVQHASIIPALQRQKVNDSLINIIRGSI